MLSRQWCFATPQKTCTANGVSVKWEFLARATRSLALRVVHSSTDFRIFPNKRPRGTPHSSNTLQLDPDCKMLVASDASDSRDGSFSKQLGRLVEISPELWMSGSLKRASRLISLWRQTALNIHKIL